MCIFLGFYKAVSDFQCFVAVYDYLFEKLLKADWSLRVRAQISQRKSLALSHSQMWPSPRRQQQPAVAATVHLQQKPALAEPNTQ
jgi:hypothetical protein